jgi:hypothetical protein
VAVAVAVAVVTTQGCSAILRRNVPDYGARQAVAELTSIPIRELLTRVHSGRIRIPAFQRDFVWDAERIAHFMDSIYKGYPYGSLLFWSTQEQLASDKKIGPYELPSPGDKLPITYVLDGQQRVTSLFLAFQTDLPRASSAEYPDIYFDLTAEPAVQQSQFVALSADDVNPAAHFPLRTLFDPKEYRLATDVFRENAEYLERLDDVYSRFKEAGIPVQIIETEDRATVAIVFERINRLGVELSTLELLSAWTWNEDFDLRQKFKDLEEDLELFSFGDAVTGGDLILRSCAAILQGDPSVEALMKLDGNDIRGSFDRVQNGIKGAVEFLSKQLHVDTVKTLPYPLMLVPLSVYFAISGEQLRQTPASEMSTLKRWFWRACFAERYSGQTLRAARTDITEMAKLRRGEANDLGNFTVSVTDDWFLGTSFRMNSARTATFVNLLANRTPRSFISGNKVDLKAVLQAYNKSEFHHIYPKAFLEEQGVDSRDINSLANFCFLSRADNNKIRRKKPSVYRELMPDEEESLREIFDAALLGEDDFDDDFDAFRRARAKRLTTYASALCGLIPPAAPPPAAAIDLADRDQIADAGGAVID